MYSGKVLGVTGLPLSGKTMVANMLEERGFSVLDMGDVVRKEMESRDMPSGKEAEFVNNQRDKNGMGAIAKISRKYLEKMMDGRDIVITGMRGWSEKKVFEEFLGDEMEIVALWASRQTRKNRRNKRMRKEDLKGQEFHERDLREINNGVAKLMALSDVLIINDDIEIEKLEEKVDEKVLSR